MKLVFLLISICFISCSDKKEDDGLKTENRELSDGINLIILGTIQDAGSPHIACQKKCCQSLFNNPSTNRQVVSLGIIDHDNQKTYLIEATPDMPKQLKRLKNAAGFDAKETSDGVFITHAHIGHYTGLMYFGKEAMNSNKIPVYIMPQMKVFLENNGPWSQLVKTENIVLNELTNKDTFEISQALSISPVKVPHRDEYSETVGFRIIGKNKTALFIPDIDKWEKWESDIINEIAKVDLAFIDGTFYDAEEISNRDITQIPHPFIIESMEIFKNLKTSEKAKIHFIHYNHTNPVINPSSKASVKVLENGFRLSRINESYNL